jgi:hypothetical protein
MKKSLLHLGLALFLLFAGQWTYGQATIDSTKLYEVETIDGNKYIGKIIEKDAEKVVVKTEQLGTITLKMTNVRRIDPIDPERVVNGQYWANNLLSRRYFFGPNAFSLKKGEGYYQNAWIFFNQASIGVTDNFTLGIGIVPTFLFFGEDLFVPVWATPKLAFRGSEKFHFGVGGLFAGVLGASESGIGITYGIGTIGTPDANFTVGLGYGYTAGDWADRPTISFSGMVRTGQRGYLMTENYIFGADGEGVVISFLGGRTVWERISLDYGLVLPISEVFDGFFGIPWLSLVIPFRPKSALN